MAIRRIVVFCACGLAGCGAARDDELPPVGRLQSLQHTASPQNERQASESTLDGSFLQADIEIPSSNRKVIHHATIVIEVADFGDAVSEVESLTSQCGGFIASSQLGGFSRSTRQGQWTLRVPVMQYRPLVNALIQIGELQEQQETSDEVTSEFFDLEARVRNKQQEEQRLLDHMTETTRALPDILVIEKELSRVRSEVERLQGQLKFLADQTSLSTIDLTLKEIEPFVPAERPTFVTRWQRTWQNSFESLVGIIQGIVLLVTAIFPWLLTLIALCMLPLAAHSVRRRLNASRS